MKLNKKSLALLVCVALLLTCAVGSTVAYLVDKTDSITNTFTPAKVDITVTDKVENNTKSDVQIKNNSTIDVYIRVAVVAYWKDASGNIVAPWNDYEDLPIDTAKWESTGGYYYYTEKVAANATVKLFTENGSYKAPDAPVEGAHLEMQILAQAIQADGMDATSAQEAFAKAKGGTQ